MCIHRQGVERTEIYPPGSTHIVSKYIYNTRAAWNICKDAYSVLPA